MFGEEIRKLRKANGLTLTQLEELTGISHSYLSQLERGERGSKNPPTEIFSKLAKTLKVSKLHLYRVAGLLDETDILEIVDENKRLRETLESVQSQLISIRGLDNVHDSEITGVCVEIRKTLKGGEIK